MSTDKEQSKENTEGDHQQVDISEDQEKLKIGDAGFKWFTCPTCDGRGSVPQDAAPLESQEEMAIKFIEWASSVVESNYASKGNWYVRGKIMTSKQLLDLFKSTRITHK